MRVGLREANQHFSKAVRAVRAGKEVILTQRGRAIAVIKPLREDAEDSAFRTMVEQGFLIPASRKGPMPPPRWRPEKVKGGTLSRTIIEDREESV